MEVMDRSDRPLVSCIMPTNNRRHLVGAALAYFRKQDYSNREMVIVDDGTDSISDLVPNDDPQIRYFRSSQRTTVGAKRNLACREAGGEVIAHWDDDDWMADWRLSYQVENLLKARADVCGLDRLYFYDVTADKAWKYVYPRGSACWVAGGTLCYRKSFWRGNPFLNINIGEDTRFVWTRRPKRVLALEDETFYVAMIHPGNTSPKRTGEPRYVSCPSEEIRKLVGPDWSVYAQV